MKERRSEKLLAPQTVDIWGGVECTVNRIKDQYYDQFKCSGHLERLSDLDLIAQLGIRTLRYPVLWERVAPEHPDQPHWDWSDERLNKLKSLGIEPIVGLLHHGSGPVYTSLSDPAFPEKFARFAAMVATRYPDIKLYNPINEPLTTARFSGLYGFWYPHTRDPYLFARMILNECKGIILAMKEIRKIQPDAKLIQTEDLGYTHSTPKLAYQAQFENHRRWLTFDLLCGKIDKYHPMWKMFRNLRIQEKDLLFFVQNPCPPDIIGINHYLTSERYLDHNLELYPWHLHGGNGKNKYVDVEAIRIPGVQTKGIESLLEETWQRYKLPVAVTEVHLGCTREEQMRWFVQVWQAANNLKQKGVDIRAITAWAMLGSYDWDSLLTCQRKHYEPGIFDLKAPAPRPTALAHLVKDLISNGQVEHPVLEAPGWWQREERYLHQSQKKSCGLDSTHVYEPTSAGQRPLLITGATGTLGKAIARVCAQRGILHRLISRQELDIANPAQVINVIEKLKPWAVINAAGYVRVDQAEKEIERCYRENLNGAVNLAEACRQTGIQYLTFSSDLVFEGKPEGFYFEADTPCARSVYGASKAAAEEIIRRLMPGALIVRTSAFFGPWDEYNFIIAALRTLHAGESFNAAAHVHVSPTYVPDLAHAALNLILDREQGIWHLTNDGQTSWAELARVAAIDAGLNKKFVDNWYQTQLEASSDKVPVSTALASSKGFIMPELTHALGRFMKESEYLTRKAV